jgi:hypothetical protein
MADAIVCKCAEVVDSRPFLGILHQGFLIDSYRFTGFRFRGLGCGKSPIPPPEPYSNFDQACKHCGQTHMNARNDVQVVQGAEPAAAAETQLRGAREHERQLKASHDGPGFGEYGDQRSVDTEDKLGRGQRIDSTIRVPTKTNRRIRDDFAQSTRTGMRTSVTILPARRRVLSGPPYSLTTVLRVVRADCISTKPA